MVTSIYIVVQETPQALSGIDYSTAPRDGIRLAGRIDADNQPDIQARMK